mmetsp:Transcript_3858/g.15940  ORF Transcript_3858/g.15940 Transcript_3858/m.15940 type:complete len:420 (+) Transcript_3858:5719-6978(+)
MPAAMVPPWAPLGGRPESLPPGRPPPGRTATPTMPTTATGRASAFWATMAWRPWTRPRVARASARTMPCAAASPRRRRDRPKRKSRFGGGQRRRRAGARPQPPPRTRSASACWISTMPTKRRCARPWSRSAAASGRSWRPPWRQGRASASLGGAASPRSARRKRSSPPSRPRPRPWPRSRSASGSSWMTSWRRRSARSFAGRRRQQARKRPQAWAAEAARAQEEEGQQQQAVPRQEEARSPAEAAAVVAARRPDPRWAPTRTLRKATRRRRSARCRALPKTSWPGCATHTRATCASCRRAWRLRGAGSARRQSADWSSAGSSAKPPFGGSSRRRRRRSLRPAMRLGSKQHAPATQPRPRRSTPSCRQRKRPRASRRTSTWPSGTRTWRSSGSACGRGSRRRPRRSRSAWTQSAAASRTS